MNNREQPPPTWANWDGQMVKINDDLYYTFLGEDDRPTVWHWCEKGGKWSASRCSLHDLISSEPLHLEPSVLYVCCGMHGWIRDGRWVEA